MPRKKSEVKRATFYVRLPVPLLRKFHDVCRTQKRSMNAQAEIMMEQWLEFWQEGAEE